MKKNTIRTLIALSTVSLALVAAGPASAIYRDYETPADEAPVIERTVDQSNDTPVDENGKHYCSLPTAGGGAHYVKHGGTIKVTIPADPARGIGATTITYKCNDGNWEAAFGAQASEYQFEADKAFVEGDGTLVLVNPHEMYTYTSDDGFYAQP